MIDKMKGWGTFVAALCVALPTCLIAQERVQITGNLKGINDYDKVYLAITEANGNKRLDSANIVKGKYTFDVQIKEPVEALMFAAVDRSKIKGPMMVRNDNRMQVFLAPGKLKIQHVDVFSNAEVKGGKVFQEYQYLNTLSAQYQQELMGLMRQGQSKELSAEAKASIHEQILAKQAEMNERVYGDFLRDHPDSPLYFYAMDRYLGGFRHDLMKALAYIESLPEHLQNAPEVQAQWKRIRGQIEVSIGSLAPDFTQDTPDGIPVSLSSFRGKYVLLDFWASWCGPCRQENPHVVKAYHAFKDKNFTVLGVSLDRPNDKDRWVKAIQDDKLGEWTHVSDLKYWKNDAALRYGVTGIPANFLIDPDGKIIAKNLRGQALYDKLAELLKDSEE